MRTFYSSTVPTEHGEKYFEVGIDLTIWGLGFVVQFPTKWRYASYSIQLGPLYLIREAL